MSSTSFLQKAFQYRAGGKTDEGKQIRPRHIPEKHLFSQGKPQETPQGKDNPESSLKPPDLKSGCFFKRQAQFWVRHENGSC